MVVTGELGIGKSALLDNIYERLQDDNSKNKAFVGYYSKEQCQWPNLFQSILLILPCLTLINEVTSTQNIEEKARITINRLKLKNAFIEFAKEEVVNIVVPILEDVAKKD